MDEAPYPSVFAPNAVDALTPNPYPPHATHKRIWGISGNDFTSASIVASRFEERASVAKDDLASIDGKVTDLTGGGVYKVVLDNGLSLSAKLCGKMKRFKIKVVVGDRVTIGVSPYDATHGLILHRHRT